MAQSVSAWIQRHSKHLWGCFRSKGGSAAGGDSWGISWHAPRCRHHNLFIETRGGNETECSNPHTVLYLTIYQTFLKTRTIFLPVTFAEFKSPVIKSSPIWHHVATRNLSSEHVNLEAWLSSRMARTCSLRQEAMHFPLRPDLYHLKKKKSIKI